MSAQAFSLALAVNFPLAQGVHVRSILALPTAANVPGAQLAISAQAFSFALAVNFPLAQGVQLRSLLTLPAAATCVPGEQTVHRVQAVFSFAVAVKEPVAHGAQDFELSAPVARYFPLAHSLHVSTSPTFLHVWKPDASQVSSLHSALVPAADCEPTMIGLTAFTVLPLLTNQAAPSVATLP